MSLVMEWLDDTTHRHAVLCPRKEIKRRVPTVSLENAHDSSRVLPLRSLLGAATLHIFSVRVRRTRLGRCLGRRCERDENHPQSRSAFGNEMSGLVSSQR